MSLNSCNSASTTFRCVRQQSLHLAQVAKIMHETLPLAFKCIYL